MAITEFSPGRKRRRVAYVGVRPPQSWCDDFARRQLEVVEYSAADLGDPVKLLATDSIVISQAADDVIAIHKLIRQHASTLLDHDCRVYVRVAAEGKEGLDARSVVVKALTAYQIPATGLSDAELESVLPEVREREGIAFAPAVRVLGEVSWEHIADMILDNPAGPPTNVQLSIDARSKSDEAITTNDDAWATRRVLVQRAFFDCTKVHLIQMVDGLSDVSVFRAYVEKSGTIGSRAFICFVKLGDRALIAKEYTCYQQHALNYIPYHLGPRLSHSRCGLGAHLGIIVGDFVEEAEVLRDVACDGRGVAAIANLYNTTLRGWQDLSGKDATRSLVTFFGNEFPVAVSAERQDLIEQYGEFEPLAALRERFLKQDTKPIRVGPVHGDLHATNVLVRGTDAILIDFEKAHQDMPMLLDAASLEGGLFVEGFVDDKRTAGEILASVMDLYDQGDPLDQPQACHRKDASAWYFDCVRQIRLYARLMECERGQYAAMLAYCLIRKACNEKAMSAKRQELRACAYHLGRTILSSLPKDDIVRTD